MALVQRSRTRFLAASHGCGPFSDAPVGAWDPTLIRLDYIRRPLERLSYMSKNKYTSIDLFAGAGGLSLGLHLAEIRGLFGIEKDAMAFETLRKNLVGSESPYNAYPSWPAWLPIEPMDIQSLLEDEYMVEQLAKLRGQVSVIAGGPPCQGFSVGGSRNGLDERNKLVFEMLTVIGIVIPKIAIIENVEGITRRFVARPGDKSETSVADQVVEHLNSLGYDATFKVIDVSKFGVPQTRKRTLIVGVHSSVGKLARDFFAELEELREEHLCTLGLDPVRATSAAEALEDLNNPSGRQPSPEWPRFQTSTYKIAESAYARLLRGKVPEGSFPDSHRYPNHGTKVLDLFEKAHATQPFGRLAKEFLRANNCKSDKKVLIDPELPVSTLTSHPDEFIHYSEPRSVTVREMARLQSFPDDFVFTGRYTINGDRRGLDVARCVQVGNAVPPIFALAVGTAIKKVLDGNV